MGNTLIGLGRRIFLFGPKYSDTNWEMIESYENVEI